MSGGLCVQLPFTFTTGGLTVPPYVSVCGLTVNELPVEICPDGILAVKMKGLCKGGNNLQNNGSGGRVFLCTDKEERCDATQLSIEKKKSCTTTMAS